MHEKRTAGHLSGSGVFEGLAEGSSFLYIFKISFVT
jgi:hypothetical protein